MFDYKGAFWNLMHAARKEIVQFLIDFYANLNDKWRSRARYDLPLNWNEI